MTLIGWGCGRQISNAYICLIRLIIWTSRRTACLVIFMLLAHQNVYANKNKAEFPNRVKDLSYGQVLYYFYQNEMFDALTQLAVADTRGGIKNHGNYPHIIKGGMYLSYGLVDAAKQIFLEALEDEIDAETRNRAWFYLGKVYYLNRQWDKVEESLTRVDISRLKKFPKELAELKYLQAQVFIARGLNQRAAQWIGDIPDDNVWKPYLTYNLALSQLNAGEVDNAKQVLAHLNEEELLSSLDDRRDVESYDRLKQEYDEILALKDLIQLSLATIFMDEENADSAIEAFQEVRIDGPWSDRAFFGLALAASNSGQFGLALQALSQLNERKSESALVQESHYALAYVYEQLEQPGKALEAYESSIIHYESALRRISSQIEALKEGFIDKAIHFYTSSGQPVDINNPLLASDVYGRLKVEPKQAFIAPLLAKEEFQIELTRYRQLHLLLERMEQAEQNVDSFSVMLDTRQQQRELRISETREKLKKQEAEDIELTKNKLNRLLKEESKWVYFSEEDLDNARLIDKIRNNISRIKVQGEDVQDYEEKLRRIEGYFTWQMSDQYSIKKWDTEKAMNELDEIFQEYRTRRTRLQALFEDDQAINNLSARVNTMIPRVQELKTQVENTLTQTEENLIDLARSSLTGQQAQLGYFLNASKLARARISDELLKKKFESIKADTKKADQQPVEEEAVSE